MLSALTHIIVFALGVYAGWLALRALRSGEVTLHVRYNRDRRFSRRANPVGYWTVVCWYLLLAAVTASGIVVRWLWR